MTLANGWTGGQYSVWRAAFGVALAVHFAGLLAGAELWGSSALFALAAALAACLAAGLAGRLAAAGLLSVVCVTREPPLLVVAPLLVPLLVPGQPYGSLAACGRTDPRGDWSLPPLLFTGLWLVLAATYAYSGYGRFGAVALAFPLLALSARIRPYVWLAGLVVALFGLPEISPGLLALHGITFDPAWLAPRRDASPATLLYDGSCGLCHRAVRFVLAEDRAGCGFRYAPLGGDAFHRLVPPAARAALPDSLVLVTPDGRIFTRSAALRETGFRLGGLWRALAAAAGVVPMGLLDRGYDWIARMRYRMFARPADACPVLPADLRNRFE
ncbi:MAG TPA: DCC1-like thiol-disulfide oxidoreductase family protein [Myxococcota bacterium]|nr:DCC1-like thiol-disulfide oxidoreductase family protein [Myxococcota bacterium]